VWIQVESLEVSNISKGGSETSPGAAPVVEAEADVTPAERSIIQKLLRTRLVETTKQQLEIVRKDPTSPLFSATSFEELSLYGKYGNTYTFISFLIILLIQLVEELNIIQAVLFFLLAVRSLRKAFTRWDLIALLGYKKLHFPFSLVNRPYFILLN